MNSFSQVIWINPQIMHGSSCFTGTRVPVQALIDHLETGHTVDDFLEGFPSVTRQQAFAFLELAAQHLAECVSA